MKKLCILLSLLMLLSLAACGGSGKDTATVQETPAEAAVTAEPAPAEDFVWTRQGYFADEDQNLVSIMPSDDAEYPGWYVGGIFGEDMVGWYIPQEGSTLRGDLQSPYMDGAEPFIVTVSEEGDDGIAVQVEDGRTYHLTPYELPTAAFAVTVNTEGFGSIAYAEGDETPVFDDEHPYQSSYIGLEGPATYTFAARPDDGWKFLKWTCGGADFSAEQQITMEITDNTDLVAVFGIAGTGGEHVELDAVTTLGELFGLPDYGRAMTEDKYIFAFEQDGMIYRAEADLPADVSEAVWAIDWDDAERDAKLEALLSPLPIVSLTNLSEGIPSREEMDALVGRTGAELLADGWYDTGGNLETMEFSFRHGAYDFLVRFEGEIEIPEDFEGVEFDSLVVSSVEYDGIGDPAFLEDVG